MKKIEAKIGDKLVTNKQGIDKLIKFLDGIYLKDEKIEKKNIPDVSPENIEDKKVHDMFLESDNSQEVLQTADTNNEELTMWDIMKDTIKKTVRPEGSVNIQEAFNEGQEDNDLQEIPYIFLGDGGIQKVMQVMKQEWRAEEGIVSSPR